MGFLLGNLNAAPIPTKSVTSAAVYAIGDLLVQRMEGKHGRNQSHANAAILDGGLIAHGPMSHYWYETLFFTK